MNLQETIKRVLRETKEDKIKSFMFTRFDRIFNKLTLEVKDATGSLYGKWVDEKNEDVFHRNNWGVLWVIECDPYKKLRSYSSSLLLDLNDFKNLLIEYINGKYGDQFNDKLIREIGDEYSCLKEGYLYENTGIILREEVKTKSTNKEFSKYKDSKFNTLREYTLQDIVDNWDTLSDHKNDNIKTIKYFVNNPSEIDELLYDDKGLEDGYHRLIAMKILKKLRFKFKLMESVNLQENIQRIKEVMGIINESDPKTGTGKKPKGSDRRLYTDENPSDTVSVKFKTKQDVIDTLNKESFKSKSHARQSQIINLIHHRLRVALERAKDPEVKKRLRTAFEYIETKKESSKRKTKGMKEGLHDTSWQNDEGDKITLMDLLNATEDIPVERVSVEELKTHLLTWDGDEDEVKKIESADLQYPILIFVDNDGEFISIIDGHHRAQKAVRRGLKTIKAKVIPINDLPKDIRKVFSHMGRQEEMKEGELTEKCWAGYTQKGMKTMFGKRYPNCVKKTKK